MVAALLNFLLLATSTNVQMETDASNRNVPHPWKIATVVPGKNHHHSQTQPPTHIKLTFALSRPKSAVTALTDTVLRVSDPDHADYGKYLLLEEVDKLLSPGKEAVNSVRSYISKHAPRANIFSNGNGDTLQTIVTVAEAEAILSCRYNIYRHGATNRTILRAQSYSLPSDLSKLIDFVSPTVRFPAPTSTSSLTRKPLAFGNTPESLRKLYRVGDTEASSSKNIQACTAFLNQHYKQSDLDKFWKRFYPKASGREIKVIGPNEGSAGVEASLDIEYISTLGGGSDTQFWSFAGNAPDNRENEPFLDWLVLMGNTSDTDIPLVFSTSYGEAENTVSMAYMNRVEEELQKQAVRGISLLFASGDSGVADDNGGCKGGRFAGQWPAGSPWVTAVGGTSGGSITEDGTSESAWSGSSGGFSDRWTIPDYQANAVAKYKSNSNVKLPPSSYWNNTGRGFPDVSAQATGFNVINNGFDMPGVAGTSCASPTFSGVVSLLNDIRLKAGKPALGLLNPLFYKNPAAFNDITKGSNPGCGTHGFPATEGWDPVTGLGTPNYEKLAQVVEALK